MRANDFFVREGLDEIQKEAKEQQEKLQREFVSVYKVGLFGGFDFIGSWVIVNYGKNNTINCKNPKTKKVERLYCYKGEYFQKKYEYLSSLKLPYGSACLKRDNNGKEDFDCPNCRENADCSAWNFIIWLKAE